MTDWASKLAAHLGIQAQYQGFEGQTIDVSPDTQWAVLCAMGLDLGSDADAGDCLQQMQQDAAQRPLPQEIIVTAGQRATVPLAHAVEWVLEAETGGLLAEGLAKSQLALPALPIGIHHLRLSVRAQEFTTWVLARPERAVTLADLMDAPRIWGVLGALYGMTDGTRGAIGTYDLLGDYAAAMAQKGADFLGINPVHAMGETRPDDVISPYSPSHRAFLNTWHCNGPRAAGAAANGLVDYASAVQDTSAMLSAQFDAFEAEPDGSAAKLAYATFAREAGPPLDEFALFEALSARFGADWRDWPEPLGAHDAAQLADFSAAHALEIKSTKWAQWRADVDLAAAHSRAKGAGMRVGLYLDLAVGPRLGGAETWVKDTPLVTGATLGAPPDPLGPLGQSWGLAPLSPLKCRVEGYAGFARLLRSAMRHAGMIRIDHVLGLMRSFWIPEGSTEGAYVSYPLDALLAVVTIESQRNGTIVVGEDLGLVPEGLREKLAGCGIYGLDVLQYMRAEDGGFVAPSETRKSAVFAFATHDTPTIAGFFDAEDARMRHASGLIDTATLEDTRADRASAQKKLNTTDPVREIHQTLAQSSAEMVAIQLDDVAARTEQQNLPGTVDSYPNWRLKAPFTANEIKTSAAFGQLAQDMRAHDRSNRTGMEKEK